MKNVSSVQWGPLAGGQSVKEDIVPSIECDPVSRVSYLTLMFIQILWREYGILFSNELACK